jgi:hypothetical protein
MRPPSTEMRDAKYNWAVSLEGREMPAADLMYIDPLEML